LSLEKIGKRKAHRYYERMRYLLPRFEKCLEMNDYVEAAEKAWGIVSAFVNVYALTFEGREYKNDEKKKRKLVEFLNTVLPFDDELRKLVEDFSRGHVETLARALKGLHTYFYGGTTVSEYDAKHYLSYAKILLRILNEYAMVMSPR